MRCWNGRRRLGWVWSRHYWRRRNRCCSRSWSRAIVDGTSTPTPIGATQRWIGTNSIPNTATPACSLLSTSRNCGWWEGRHWRNTAVRAACTAISSFGTALSFVGTNSVSDIAVSTRSGRRWLTDGNHYRFYARCGVFCGTHGWTFGCRTLGWTRGSIAEDPNVRAVPELFGEAYTVWRLYESSLKDFKRKR